MSVRVPRSYKVFWYGVLYRKFPSRKATAEYMVDNHFWDLKLSTMYYTIISKFPYDGSRNYYGFTFEGDPDWVKSKPVRAVDDETSEVFVKDSVMKMELVIFGDMKNYGGGRISRLIRSCERYRGLRFEYVPNNYVDCETFTDSEGIPVTGINLRTMNVIAFLSVRNAARYVKETQLLKTNIQVVARNIGNCASRYMGKSNESYGYRWIYTG